MHNTVYTPHQGIVRISEFDPSVRSLLLTAKTEFQFNRLIETYAYNEIHKGNLVFNFPREQYAKLDRGQATEAINANWLTLANTDYLDPTVQVVSGETLRLPQTTKAPDANDPKATIIRFIIDVGQFIGSFSTAILIGGATVSSTPGSGKIVAAVNDLLDDLGAPFERDGSTVHLVSWKLKHSDVSEV